MNILYLTAWDSYGIQFNGYLLSKQLEKLGITSRMYVSQKKFNDPNIMRLGNDLRRKSDKIINGIENLLSLQRIYNFSFQSLFASEWYQEADIVHLQMVHALPFMGLLSIPRLAKGKKLVWTIHDPWLATGHCVYFIDCEKWKTGCGHCPDLKRHFPVRNDLTRANWQLKKTLFSNIDVNLIVASEWMLNVVKQSPILSHLPCTVIPFGIDIDNFKPLNKMDCRRELNIPEDSYVISCRWASHNLYKGVEYLKKALEALSLDKPIYILGFDSYENKPDLPDRYTFINLGWVDDQEKVAHILNASDAFIMPSLAEAFGLMAIESMACGIPVVVFEGTSLPSVIHAPYGGISIPRDSSILAEEMRNLLLNTNRRKQISQTARKIVTENYQFINYAQRHADLYAAL